VLYHTQSSAFEVSAPVVIAVGVVIAAGIGSAATKALEARKRPVRTGWEELIGAEGDVRVPLSPVGQVFVAGALWRARTAADETIEVGSRVRVIDVDALTLIVERPVALHDSQPEPTAAAAQPQL
jgi:membrane-bound serine protease (ClpP class)